MRAQHPTMPVVFEVQDVYSAFAPVTVTKLRAR